jgi:hypothetical protein
VLWDTAALSARSADPASHQIHFVGNACDPRNSGGIGLRKQKLFTRPNEPAEVHSTSVHPHLDVASVDSRIVFQRYLDLSGGFPIRGPFRRAPQWRAGARCDANGDQRDNKAPATRFKTVNVLHPDFFDLGYRPEFGRNILRD